MVWAWLVGKDVRGGRQCMLACTLDSVPWVCKLLRMAVLVVMVMDLAAAGHRHPLPYHHQHVVYSLVKYRQ